MCKNIMENEHKITVALINFNTQICFKTVLMKTYVMELVCLITFTISKEDYSQQMCSMNI